jgi:hypothetical protein
VATVITEALAETVLVPEDEAPEEVEAALDEMSLATDDVPVVELEDNVEEVAEDVSLEVEELARDEEATEDEKVAGDELPALEVPDAVAIWAASESWIDFKIADGIHVVSELEYPGNPRPKIRSIEKSCNWSTVIARSHTAERLAALDALIAPAPVFANSP